MKGDFTRDSFAAEKHYQRVLMQQGRVQLDADWNEQAAISERRDETTACDIIGACGGPVDNAAFRLFTDAKQLTDNDRSRLEARFFSLPADQQPVDLSAKPPSFVLKKAGDFFLSSGRYYVDGIQCENECAIPFTVQPDRSENVPLPLPSSGKQYYLMYLDVWQRHLTPLDDPEILDAALNGVDTATRLKTVWQVRALDIGTVPPGICSDTFNSYNDVIAPSGITMSAWTDAPAVVDDPCIIAESSGYKGLENQLYRVEIHDVDGDGKAIRWKWSRENGAVAIAVSELKTVGGTTVLTVKNIGPGGLPCFHDDDIVELIDDQCEMEGRSGALARIDGNPDNNLIKLKKFSGDALPAGITFPAKLRRWEGCAKISGSKQPLEHGVYIRFEAAEAFCRSGDYWQIPARTATATAEAGDIEWPQLTVAKGKPDNNKPLAQLPKGIIHHYCRLGVVAVDDKGSLTEYTDCRCLWPALTAPLIEYVSGDGQEVMPDLTTNALKELPEPIVVYAQNLHCCHNGVTLRYSVTPASDELSVTLASQTFTSKGILDIPGATGIIACTWKLDPTVQPPENHRVTAALVDSSGTVLTYPHPIIFNANLSIASQVAYYPGLCAALKNRNTVQKAIDHLAVMVSLYKINGDGQQALAGAQLEKPLTVLVANRCGPVDGRKVTFSVILGGGKVEPVSGTTTSGGILECFWTLGAETGLQIVEAEVLAENDWPVTEPRKVHFMAQQIQTDLNDPAPVHIIATRFGKDANQVLHNGQTLTPADLQSGLYLFCDKEIDPDTVIDPISLNSRVINRGEPTCILTVEVPYPLYKEQRNGLDINDLAGYQPVILHGIVAVDNNLEKIGAVSEVPKDAFAVVIWRTEGAPVTFLERILLMLKDLQNEKRLYPDKVLIRLTLKGNFIWSREAEKWMEKGQPGGFLDGETFRASAPKPGRSELIKPSGDNRRGGDFEMWFWIATRTIPNIDVVFDKSRVTGVNVVKGTIKLDGAAQTDLVVALTSSNTEIARLPKQVTVPKGASSVEFLIQTSLTGDIARTVEIAASLQETPHQGKAALTVEPMKGVAGVSIEPLWMVGGQPAKVTVTFSKQMAANATVKLASSAPRIAGVSPAQFAVADRSDSLAFTIVTKKVKKETPVTVTATSGAPRGGEIFQFTLLVRALPDI
ncbi:MAG: DUF6519 domain-containing protein [Desulfuromonadaceae bacterium]